jgi:signal transduction histidine kinase
VNDLLDTSRIQTGNLELARETFNLSEVVEEIALRFKEQLNQARCPLELHLEPEIMGEWDRYRLEQVIVNLISNAIKYAPQTKITITTHKERDCAVLIVCDEGPGIDMNKLETIFNRFERGNSPQNVGGLGLGLFITRKIVEHHRGTIRAESSPGHGARFIIELPLR